MEIGLPKGIPCMSFDNEHGMLTTKLDVREELEYGDIIWTAAEKAGMQDAGKSMEGVEIGVTAYSLVLLFEVCTRTGIADVLVMAKSGYVNVTGTFVLDQETEEKEHDTYSVDVSPGLRQAKPVYDMEGNLLYVRLGVYVEHDMYYRGNLFDRIVTKETLDEARAWCEKKGELHTTQTDDD